MSRDGAADSRLVTRVRLRNYKSIGACDVRPAPLSFLVGPNGSGKSNFLDALRFVAEALRFSLDHALRERGGIREVRRRSGGHPNHFGIRLDLQFPHSEGWYAFRVRAKARGGYGVQQEECFVAGADGHDHYRVEDGAVVSSTLPNPPACASDRLYLVAMSGFPAFRPVYDALSGMGFYNLNPHGIRDLQAPDPGDLLKGDGGNLASVLAKLDSRDKTTVEEYLAAITPGITGVAPRTIGSRLTLDFRQEVRGAQHPQPIPASSMSDGTLRALGVLVALFQGNGGNGAAGTALVGIEEPEIALHPAAAGVLIDSLTEASQSAQVIVSSHSADLLDNDTISDTSIIAALSEHAETRIGPLDEAGRSSIRDHLFTAGELLRIDQLCPDPDQSSQLQVDLFETAEKTTTSDEQPEQARGKRRPSISGERLPWQPFTESPRCQFSTVRIDEYRGVDGLVLEDLCRINVIAGVNDAGKTSVLEAIYLLAHQNDEMALLDTLRSRGRFDGEPNPAWLVDQIQPRIDVSGNFDRLPENAARLTIRRVDDPGNDIEDHTSFLARLLIESGYGGQTHSTVVALFSDQPHRALFEGRNWLCRAALTSSFGANRLAPEQANGAAPDAGAKAKVIDLIKTRLDPGIANIEMADDHRRFLVNHVDFERAPDLSSFGSGMRRVFEIGLLFAGVQGGVLLIDEFESAIHPQLLAKFTRVVQELAREHNVQVFLTTQSKEAVDAFVLSEYAPDDLAAYAIGRGQDGVGVRRFDGQKLKRLHRALDFDIRGMP